MPASTDYYTQTCIVLYSKLTMDQKVFSLSLSRIVITTLHFLGLSEDSVL